MLTADTAAPCSGNRPPLDDCVDEDIMKFIAAYAKSVTTGISTSTALPKKKARRLMRPSNKLFREDTLEGECVLFII